MEYRWLTCQECGWAFRYPADAFRARCIDCEADDVAFHWASLLTTAALGACMMALLAWRIGWL